MFRTLTAGDFDAVVACFNEAFSDYAVSFTMTAPQLGEINARRAVVFELSVGAFDGGRLVGFTLNGFDGETAYDSGTGVVPSHRRQGLARGMITFMLPRLRDAGARRYLLEVIETNTRAVALYQSLGFTTTRPLTCWKRETGNAVSEVAIRPAIGPIDADWDLFASFLDAAPAWQNSEASIRRARDPRVILGAFDGDLLAGFAIVFPLTHDLAQLAVRRTHRRRGIGAALLDRAAVKAEGMVRILNVDARDEGIGAFLRASGAEQFIRQSEMSRPL
ncbi:MAG TPA: GNAT family N-acetyltransferase [Thermoanaerobaculia bacterium]